MIRALAILTFSFLVAGPLSAAEATAPAAKSGPKAGGVPEPTPVPKIELKHLSSFKVESSIRNPFWPIGWKPSAKISDVGTDQAGPEVPPAAFRVSSIAVEAGGRFAIINGRVMEEGQQFGLQLGSQTYQITVKAIEDGRVILARRDQEIVVLLQRR
ncbi:MAG: hypothetical protein ABI946_07280 [Chthoniobacterales bacterium]